MSLPWFRMYHEFSGDPVVQALAFEDQRHFVMALCFKASGFLDREMPSPEFRHRAICKALGLDPVAGTDALRRLSEVGLVDGSWQPTAWDRRQFKSDNSTARSQKFRAKSEEQEIRNTDSKTDTESNVACNVAGTLRNPKPATRTATRIPDDFGVTPEREAYAAKNLPKVDVPALMEAFRDHWTAASGAKARKVDWDATWRTWVRNANQFGYPMVTQATASKPQIRIDANGRQISG